MTWEHIYPFEYEGPGYIGCFTYDFGVHEIGKTDEAGADRRCYGYHVQHIHIVHLHLTAVHPQSYHQAQCAAMTGKTCISGPFPTTFGRELYRQYHFPEMMQVIFRLIEQAVP